MTFVCFFRFTLLIFSWSFKCICPDNFIGPFCEFHVPCYDVHCQNGGVCVSDRYVFSCPVYQHVWLPFLALYRMFIFLCRKLILHVRACLGYQKTNHILFMFLSVQAMEKIPELGAGLDVTGSTNVLYLYYSVRNLSLAQLKWAHITRPVARVKRFGGNCLFRGVIFWAQHIPPCVCLFRKCSGMRRSLVWLMRNCSMLQMS